MRLWPPFRPKRVVQAPPDEIRRHERELEQIHRARAELAEIEARLQLLRLSGEVPIRGGT